MDFDIMQRLLQRPLHDGCFSKWSHFLIILCVFSPGQFFAHNNSKGFAEWILTCFGILIFDPK